MNFKKRIVDQIELLIRQFEKLGHNEYRDYLNKDIKYLFSDDIEKQNKGLESLQSYLNIKIWDGYGFTSHNPNYPKYYQDEFIDEFNNFFEFYAFLEGLVKDAEEYVNFIEVNKVSDE